MSAKNQARLYCLLIGLGLAVLGVIIGIFSHTEPYKQASGSVDAYIQGDQSNHDTSYMTLADDQAIYVVSEQDLSPTFTPDLLGDGVISLMYLPSSGQDVDVQGTAGTHLKGKGYSVYAISVVSTQVTYQTDVFASSPNAHVSDYWPYGHLLIGLGAATLLLGLIIPLSTLNIALYTLGGLIAGPIIFFVFIGFFAGDGTAGSWQQALADNIAAAVICAIIGLSIGFVAGIVQSIRKDYLADLA